MNFIVLLTIPLKVPASSLSLLISLYDLKGAIRKQKDPQGAVWLSGLFIVDQIRSEICSFLKKVLLIKKFCSLINKQLCIVWCWFGFLLTIIFKVNHFDYREKINFWLRSVIKIHIFLLYFFNLMKILLT